MKKLQEENKKTNFYAKGFYFVQIISFILVITVLVLGVSLKQVLDRGQVFLKSNDQGIPEKLIEAKENLQRLISQEKFIEMFLLTLFTWDGNTYVDQIKKCLPYMAPDVRQKYLDELETDSRIEIIQKSNVNCSIVLQEITESNITPYREGYKIEISAIKYRMLDYVRTTTSVVFTIAFRNCNISNTNYWGFEVFEITEDDYDIKGIKEPTQGG